MEIKLVCRYSDFYHEIQEQVFGNFADAFEFVEKLQEDMTQGNCIGYSLMPKFVDEQEG